jgi:hypothetical protein
MNRTAGRIYGFECIQVLLRREGWRDNHKRTYRIYKEDGLNLEASDRVAAKLPRIVSSDRC